VVLIPAFVLITDLLVDMDPLFLLFFVLVVGPENGVNAVGPYLDDSSRSTDRGGLIVVVSSVDALNSL
jgi:hypothetical protein